MNTHTDVSYIVPIYKVEPYLDACIESLLRAHAPGDEIILVDDGSPDRSGEMADAWALRHPESIRVIHQKNAGLSAARNAGIAASRCTYLIFLDSDDVIVPETLPAARMLLKEYQPDILVCDFIWWHADGKGQEVRSAPLQHQPCTPLMDREKTCHETLHDALLSACTRIYSRSLLQLLEPEVFPVGAAYEEVAAVPRLTWRAKSVIYLPEPLIKYRMRTGSITHTPTLKHCLDRSAALSLHAKELRAEGANDELLSICDFRLAHQFVMAMRDCGMLQPQIPTLYRELIERLNSYMNLSIGDAIRAAPDSKSAEVLKVINHLTWIRRSPSIYVWMRRIGSAYRRHKVAKKTRSSQLS